jgi:RNA recognition motif-containing protein
LGPVKFPIAAEKNSKIVLSFPALSGRPFWRMGEPSSTIHVRNINYRTEGDALVEAFRQFGEIASARIITETDRRGDAYSLGYGFVEFKSPEAAQRALNHHEDIIVDSRRLVLHLARPPRPPKRDTAFIAGIPEGTTVEEIKAVFAEYNPISARIACFAGASTGRGYAFVQFDTEEHQSAAVHNLKTIQLHGGESKVRFARPQSGGGNRKFSGRR